MPCVNEKYTFGMANMCVNGAIVMMMNECVCAEEHNRNLQLRGRREDVYHHHASSHRIAYLDYRLSRSIQQINERKHHLNKNHLIAKSAK